MSTINIKVKLEIKTLVLVPIQNQIECANAVNGQAYQSLIKRKFSVKGTLNVKHRS